MVEPCSAIAVDWSGARGQQGRTTWVAEVAGDRLRSLRNGWSGQTLGDWLLSRAGADQRLVVGMDFAFGFPAWFVRERFGGRPQLGWERARTAGEDWLRELRFPFWGRPGIRRPAPERDRPQLRATELFLQAKGSHPKSVFQVGGAGAVGTGSIRGMPLLDRLQKAGFSIWPFDPPRLPLVVEIYPRALTGAVVKSDPAARQAYLAGWRWPPSAPLRARLAATEHSFDAALSARQMAACAAEFARLPAPSAQELLEGRIWVPTNPLDRPAPRNQARAASPARPLDPPGRTRVSRSGAAWPQPCV